MSNCIMTVGLSGAGKTTWAHNQKDYIVLDSDELRQEVYGDATCQDNPAAVFQLMEGRARSYLNLGENVILCATNLNLKRRAQMVRTLKRHSPNTKFTCVVFNTPIDICKNNNRARSRMIPENIIDRQLRQFQYPIANEGWDEIKCLSLFKYNTEDMAKKVWNDVQNFGDQKNPHHSHTLYKHLLFSIEEIDIINRTQSDAMALLIAAGYHDVGKAYTQSFDKKGIAHYYSHENVGAYLVMNILPEFSTVIKIVNYHMLPFSQNPETWHERLGEPLWSLITALNEADRKAQ